MRVCIQWPTFGQYHVARFEAAAEILEAEGIETVGLETSAADITGRTRQKSERDAHRHTVFSRDIADLSPSTVFTKVREALDGLQPDVVAITSYSFPDARACIDWCLDNRRAMVLMSATRREDAPRTWWREWIKGRIVSQFGAAVVGGTPQHRYARQLGIPDRHIFHGYDVVNNEFFSSPVNHRAGAPAPPGLGSSTPFFLASGRMIERKDYKSMLEAYRQYRAASPAPWDLVILGDGELRSDIEQSIVEAGLEGVTLAGWQPNESLPAYYAAAGAFVHSAKVDQWGLVVNEAMAAGLPVIVSDGSGCVEDLVEGQGVGFSFPAGDVNRLAELMGLLAGDEAARTTMSIRSREVIGEWTPERFGEAMLNAVRVASQTEPSGSRFTRLLIRIVQLSSRDLTSFHSVQN
jgi:glycosyltransferase involved in cell wall biosynthesis